MGSVQRNPNGDCIEDTSLEQLISTDSPNMYNVFGEPELHPRVGEEYQVKIPPLISDSQYDLYKKSPFELKSKPFLPTDFVIGLAIPIMHMNKEPELENGLSSCKSAKEKKAYKKHLSKGYFLLPGTVGGTWSEIEEGCFLLGLYIFGKDLFSVKKFVEGKTMGDIQLFYYGKFYKSNEYRRWSDCRKVRTKKCVFGHKLFSGMRQQELLNRLFRHVSEEFQNSLSEASKNYNDGKLSLHEYVFALKAIVGIKTFVDAVAIGKAKRDLTSITIDPPKANQNAPHLSELPRGKACSSLSPQEITKYLTGSCRLSKAKSNDLFWEAVWPRLLARGWHSEQPKDEIYAFGTKNNLVFLIPGVKKFSRRKLVKGEDYFDCVTDVLNKVAMDPSLIVLDNEVGENNRNNVENGWNKDMTPENDDVSSQQRVRYLQPRTPKRVKGAMIFTIVDTSMTDGKVFRIKELRNLIDNESFKTKIVSETNSKGSDESGSEDLSQDSDIEDTKNTPPVRVLFQENIESSNDPDFEYKIAKRVREDNEDNKLGEVNRPKKSPKCYRGLKKGEHKYLSPVVKKSRKLSSCTKSAKSCDPITKPAIVPTQETRVSCSEATNSSENNQNNQMDSFSKESSIDISSEELSKKPRTRELIDLNFPQVSAEFENGEVLTTECDDKKCDEIIEPENFTATERTIERFCSDNINADNNNNNNNNNSRRHSTRNRPPTARALEALANGFLTINTRKKRNKNKAGHEQSSSSRPHQSESLEDLGNNGSDDTHMTDVENGESNGDSGAFEKSRVFF